MIEMTTVELAAILFVIIASAFILGLSVGAGASQKEATMTDWKRYQGNRKRLGERREYQKAWQEAEADVSELIAENERLRGLLVALVVDESPGDEYGTCPYCGLHDRLPGHDKNTDCPVTKARAALEEK